MIRKILIIFLIIFSAAWFSIAYLLKVRTASVIENLRTPSIELSYARISVTGFPAGWHVRLKEPKLKIVSNNDHKEISTSEIDCSFDLSFKKAKLVIKDKIMQEQDFGPEKTYYYLGSDEPIVATLKFSKPFYRLSKSVHPLSAIKSFILKSVNLNGTFQNEKIFDIDNLDVSLKRSASDNKKDIALQIQGSYRGQNYLLGFNSARLKLDSVLLNSGDTAPDAQSHKIYRFNNFELDIDDDSKINLVGSLEDYSDKLPQGQFFVALTNYPKIVDRLVHPNFIVPKSTLKQIIATEGNDEMLDSYNNFIAEKDKAKIQTTVEINLSEAGIKIGSVNLFDVNKDSFDTGSNETEQ